MTATENPESLVNRIIAELEARPEVKPTLLRALLTDEFLLLPSKVDRLMDLVPAVETLQQDVSELKEGQARLTQDVSELKEGQARLTQDVSELREGQARLEDGQTRLERGQQRMGGELSSLSGSQYQRDITQLGIRLVRREMGFRDPRLLHGDMTFGERVAARIGDEAEAKGLITEAENDQLIFSDVILAGLDEAGQPVQAVLEVSLTVQQSDIERAVTRARILEKATGIRTLAGVVGETVPEEERNRAQERGVTCFTVQSGRPPQ